MTLLQIWFFCAFFGFFLTICYSVTITFCMQRFSSLILHVGVLLSIFLVGDAFANNPVNSNITSMDFQVNTCAFDILGTATCTNGGTGGPSGVWALFLLLGKFSTLLLTLIPILAVVGFLVAGYYYIISGGSSEKATQAKTIIKWNIIAMLVGFFSFAIIKLVQYIIS